MSDLRKLTEELYDLGLGYGVETCLSEGQVIVECNGETWEFDFGGNQISNTEPESLL